MLALAFPSAEEREDFFLSRFETGLEPVPHDATGAGRPNDPTHAALSDDDLLDRLNLYLCGRGGLCTASVRHCVVELDVWMGQDPCRSGRPDDRRTIVQHLDATAIDTRVERRRWIRSSRFTKAAAPIKRHARPVASENRTSWRAFKAQQRAAFSVAVATEKAEVLASQHVARAAASARLFGGTSHGVHVEEVTYSDGSQARYPVDPGPERGRFVGITIYNRYAMEAASALAELLRRCAAQDQS